MQHNVYLYILVMFGVTYLIRVLPLTLIRKEIKNRTIRSFLYYVPYVTLAVMTFPAIIDATSSPLAGLAALGVLGPPDAAAGGSAASVDLAGLAHLILPPCPGDCPLNLPVQPPTPGQAAGSFLSQSSEWTPGTGT